MNKRKSIVSNFSALSIEPAETPASSSSPQIVPTHVAPLQAVRVGAGVIGATQRTLTDIREERDQLQALLDAGGALEIDPSLIDPSPFPDRMPDDSGLGFEAFKNLIAEEGQQVPIEVRRHPESVGRYQIVYGHRRWRAAGALGRRVKAVIVNLTDRELVIAQGIENASRQDLSWIEKALFAWRMDQQNVKARDIRAALAIDDPELARFRAVCRTLTVEVIESIGRAPKVGRPRWVSLANTIEEDSGALDRIRKTLADAKVLASDLRFRVAADAVKKAALTENMNLSLSSPSGEVVGRASFVGGGVKLTIDDSRVQAFSTFLQGELPALMDRFFAQTSEI